RLFDTRPRAKRTTTNLRPDRQSRTGLTMPLMLSTAENEYLCRVGPGTPMGNLMRQYWLPAIRADELPQPDGAPLRVRLLGENLIAFRTASGTVGLLQNHCPHRGASLFF